MSFILDALKKSESERHRHSGPVLMDVRIAPPRRRLPMWAWAIAGVLLVNLLLLAWLLWLAPDHNPAAAAPASAAAITSVTPPAAPQTGAAPPPAAPQTAAPQTATQSPEPGATPAPALTTPAPAVSAGNAPTTAEAQRIDPTNLPRVQDLIAAGTPLPELHLSLHVYDPVPANRYVLLNGARLHEGEFTPDGMKLLQITSAGAVLEWRGRRMFLSAGG